MLPDNVKETLAKEIENAEYPKELVILSTPFRD